MTRSRFANKHPEFWETPTRMARLGVRGRNMFLAVLQDMPPTKFRVLAYLITIASSEGHVGLSRKQISSEIRLRKKTLNDHINWLVKREYIGLLGPGKGLYIRRWKHSGAFVDTLIANSIKKQR